MSFVRTMGTRLWNTKDTKNRKSSKDNRTLGGLKPLCLPAFNRDEPDFDGDGSDDGADVVSLENVCVCSIATRCPEHGPNVGARGDGGLVAIQ